MSYHGIDVSEFQGTINWKRVADNGIDFAMVRCGFDGYQDPYWKQNVNNAKANGLNVGAYWFMYFTNENEAIDNAKQFIQELRKFDGMIITGAPLDYIDFENVDYWEEVCTIMDWCKAHVHCTMHLCWGAFAAFYHYYGIH